MAAKVIRTSKLKSLTAATPAAASRAILKAGQDLLAIAKQLVPVDTSSLKDSGGAVPVSSTTVLVGFGGPGVYYANREPEKYAVHVEYGTVNSPAQPYLRPAFTHAKDTYEKRLKEEMEKLIK